ncbi:phage gene 29 protein family protein [Nocardia vulneris]|uniref:phage gene 29 protein family protein n=1 Tax=Nocardia vulneris TaxID=1141657 RepID=UPI00068C9208|nr:DUF2744 domain-containing protein [Nocardia vulneris]
MTRIPHQSECNMDDPEEHALWALVCPPATGQTPILLPLFVAKNLAKALWNCGFRHHPELQTVKFQRPFRGQQHPMNGMGRWVPIDTPEPDLPILPNLAEMTPHEVDDIVQQARALGAVPEIPEPPNHARVVNGDA